MNFLAKNTMSKRAIAVLTLVTFWFASLGSGLAVVYSSFESRKAIQRLETLRREESDLRVMSGQLLLEKSSWSSYVRVEKVAQEKLHMRIPESEQTILVYKQSGNKQLVNK